MSTVKPARVSKTTVKTSNSARSSQWHRSLFDSSSYQMVKCARYFTEVSSTNSILFKDTFARRQSNWSKSVRIERQNGPRNRKLEQRALAIFSPHKTQGLPEPFLPDLCLRNNAEFHLYERCLSQADRYLKQHDRFTTLRHIKTSDRGNIRHLVRAQASHVDPLQISIGAVLGPSAIRSWLRHITARNGRPIPEIAVPVVKSFLKAFQLTLQILRAKENDTLSGQTIFTPIFPVVKRSCKRSRPSEFDLNLEQRPPKRPCIRKQDGSSAHPKNLAPIRPVTPIQNITNGSPDTPSSTSSSDISYLDEDDDSTSVCSTDTSCTAFSYHEDSPPLSLADSHLTETSSEGYRYQEFPLSKIVFWKKLWALQERAIDSNFSPTEYDRSFSLPVAGWEVDESIESKEPSSSYPVIDDAEAQGVLEDLESLHLDAKSERNDTKSFDTPVKPVDLPRQTSALERISLPSLNPSANLALNDAKHTQILNPLQTTPQQPLVGTSPTNSSEDESHKPATTPQPILGKRKACEAKTNPLDIVRNNLDLVPAEHHQLLEQLLSQCEGSNLENEECDRSIKNPMRVSNLIEALHTGNQHGFEFTGDIFYFRELSTKTGRKWYVRLWKQATDAPGDFCDVLTTMFMKGLHPKDCFERGSTWIEHFFDESGVCLDNRRIDDRYAWYDLKCKMDNPTALELPGEDDEKLVEKFMDEASLDILQKVMEDWLGVDSGDLVAKRIQHFRDAMKAAYLCGFVSNKDLQELIQWLDGCQMGHADTCNDPRQASRREAFERALENVLWYRYPRSCKWDASAELLLESYNERDEDDDEWLVDNEIPGRDSS